MECTQLICYIKPRLNKPFQLLFGASTPNNIFNQDDTEGYKQLLFANALQISILLIFKIWFAVYVPAYNLCSVSSLLFTKPSGQSVNPLPTIWRISFLIRIVLLVSAETFKIWRLSFFSFCNNLCHFLSNGNKSSAFLLRACQTPYVQGMVWYTFFKASTVTWSQQCMCSLGVWIPFNFPIIRLGGQ